MFEGGKISMGGLSLKNHYQSWARPDRAAFPAAPGWTRPDSRRDSGFDLLSNQSKYDMYEYED